MILDKDNIMTLEVGDMIKYSGNVVITKNVWESLYSYLSTKEIYEILEIIRGDLDNRYYCRIQVVGSTWFYPSEVFYIVSRKQCIADRYGLK